MGNDFIKRNFPKLHFFIKVLLLILLLAVIYVSIETLENILGYILKTLNLKNSESNSMDNSKGLPKKNPNNPQDPQGVTVAPTENRKKKNPAARSCATAAAGDDKTYPKAKADEKLSPWKEMLSKHEITEDDLNKFKDSSPKFRTKFRYGKIELPAANPDIGIDEQIKLMEIQRDKYALQEKKFADIIKAIDENREIFYPPEARELFVSYLGIVTPLRIGMDEQLNVLYASQLAQHF